MTDDDKRLVPQFTAPHFYHIRKSLRRWRWCRYCERDTPQFVLAEGICGDNGKTIQVLRCCWECGSGVALHQRPKCERVENWMIWRDVPVVRVADL